MPATLLPPPRDPSGPYRISCVCLGNICRSPIAEVVLRARLEQAGLDGRVEVDSSGTGSWHQGEPMHKGSYRELQRAGYDPTLHRARQIQPEWLADYDLILAMDATNLRDLKAMAGDHDPDNRIRLFGEIAGLDGMDIPDPWGGPADEFADVRSLIETGVKTLVTALSATAPR